MSRQTRALHKPGKAAADSTPAELPLGTIRQMHARFAERDGRPAPKYPKGRSVVAEAVVAAVAGLPEVFTFADIRALFTEDQFTTMRLGQHLNLLVNAGQLARTHPRAQQRNNGYRRLPAFDAAQTADGPPLTDIEKRYRALRAEIKAVAESPTETIGDVLVHPSQR